MLEAMDDAQIEIQLLMLGELRADGCRPMVVVFECNAPRPVLQD